MAWKRSDWNDIIDRVNTLSQNPDQGCTALEPLEEAGPNHVWTETDINMVRGRLHDICEDDTFDAATVKWAHDIITEIEDMIDEGWCGCEQPWQDYEISVEYETVGDPLNGGGTNEGPPSSDWSVFDVEGCRYGCPPGRVCTTAWSYGGTIMVYGPVDLQVGPPGITGRYATIQYHTSGVGYYNEWLQEEWDQDTAVYSYHHFPIGEDGWLHLTEQYELGRNNSEADSLSCVPSGCALWYPQPGCPGTVTFDYSDTRYESTTITNLRLVIHKTP